MKKVLVIGCCGAGKSTFSKKLQSILILGKAMEKYSKALDMNNELESKIMSFTKSLKKQTIIQ